MHREPECPPLLVIINWRQQQLLRATTVCFLYVINADQQWSARSRASRAFRYPAVKRRRLEPAGYTSCEYASSAALYAVRLPSAHPIARSDRIAAPPTLDRQLHFLHAASRPIYPPAPKSAASALHFRPWDKRFYDPGSSSWVCWYVYRCWP